MNQSGPASAASATARQEGAIDLSWCRAEFPALQRTVGGQPAAFLDGPGGTQVPQAVIEAMATYLVERNANTHGAFPTSRATDETIAAARAAMADFLGATPAEVAFGPNMTTLNFNLARAIGRTLRPGDEIVVTELDHDANVSPWLVLQEQGAVIRWLPVDPATCTLDLDRLGDLLGRRTRVVAIGWASNAVGTVNDVARAVRMAHEAGALAVVDAVHYAPHGPIDVRAIGCDFLLCSAYKFFGPHVGVLYGRRAAFEALETYRVRPQSAAAPEKIETGTLNHEGLAGLTAAVDFLARLGQRYLDAFRDAVGGATGRRAAILAAMHAIEAYEAPLAERLRRGLATLPGVKVYGPPEGHPRTPTVSFTVAGRHPAEVARFLAERGLFVWDGDFYAVTLIERLGLKASGGLVRVGLAPYNTAAEIERLLEAVEALGRGGSG
ncbi:MAG: cysteine desulfurase-like protein [Bacillota bacterium]|nr:MAG: cysteine desulfurase-like protein [Bacillota bacterium]